jgi:hypothetical protein
MNSLQNGKYFHAIVCVPLMPLGKSWPLMCVDVCGDVCVMCVCGGDASYDTNDTQAMAPKWSPYKMREQFFILYKV